LASPVSNLPGGPVRARGPVKPDVVGDVVGDVP
jgi:hypothetical protein